MPRSTHFRPYALRVFRVALLTAFISWLALPGWLVGRIQPTARAASIFTVNSTDDGADANAGDGICADSSGRCTLRAAIQEANALTGDDTINITVTGTINLTGALPDLSTNLAINGPGANILSVRRDTGGNYRVFTVAVGATVQINELSVTNGRSADGLDGTLGDAANGQDGGGIYNSGTLTLKAVAISGNQTGQGGAESIDSGTDGNGGRGGGLFNAGTLSLLNCTVNGNMTSRSGVGGIGNKGGDGGGIANLGTLNLISSTVSGNHAAGSRIGGDGGAIFSNGSATLTACTVTANSAGGSFHDSVGGGIRVSGGTATLRNTIVAGNTDTGAGTPDLSGAFNSEGFNLIQSTSGATINETANNGTNITGANPRLGQLVDNGGPTLTHVLLTDSPARDTGDDSVLGSPLNLSTDQRGTGFQRLINTHVDIGAVEVNYQLSATAGTPQSTPFNMDFAIPLQVALTESGRPVQGISVTFAAPASGASGTFPGTGTNIATVITDSHGVATAPVFTANGLVGGPYNVVASLGAGSPSVGYSLTNAKGNQTITFEALSNKTFGDPDFTISAAASSGLPVSFGALGSCTVSSSTVHITGAGSCRITATQFGDSNYNGAAAVSRVLNIAQASTTTSLSSSANPSSYGQNVTFTATVTSAAGTPPGGILGSVFFFDGDVMIPNCSAQLSSGQATCTTSALTPGSHTITAEYATNNPNFTGSRDTLIGGQTVNGGIGFSQSTYAANERGNSVTVTVQRAGDTSGGASVDYATDDGSIPSVAVPCSSVTGIALERCDYTGAAGTLSFAAGETQKTFVVLVNDDSYTEGTETTNLRLSNPTGGVPLGSRSAATLQVADDSTESGGNPIDDSAAFVRQHYVDFLNREPDAAGLTFWTGEIESCGANQQCRDVKRINVSAAFFLSIEFQETGFLVERIYKTAFGDAQATSSLGGTQHPILVPIVRLGEFLPDTQRIGQGVIIGQPGADALLEANKNAFALEFVQRPRFLTAFPLTMTPAQVVDTMNQNAGSVLTQSES